MEDSSTYQLILEKGELRGCRRAILRQGTIRLGSPTPRVEAAVNSINDLERFGRMFDAMLNVSGWHELLATR